MCLARIAPAQVCFNPQGTHIGAQRIKKSFPMTRIGILELNLLLFARKDSFPEIPYVSFFAVSSQLDLIPTPPPPSPTLPTHTPVTFDNIRKLEDEDVGDFCRVEAEVLPDVLQ